MKICAFCGKKVETEGTCPNCGGNGVEYKCDNCGTVYNKGEYCPKCGLKEGTSPRTCPNCGMEYYFESCTHCGFEKRSSDSGEFIDDVFKESSTNVNVPPKPKRKTWLWVLGWLFCFPIPIIVLLVRDKRISTPVKITISILACLIYLIISVIAFVTDDEDNDTYNSFNISSSVTVNLSSDTFDF